MPTLHTQNQC